MKKILFSVCFLMLVSFYQTHAQRIAVIDTKAILEKIPDYKDAEKKIDAVADGWQKEVEKKYKEIDEMYKDYQANEVLLTDDMRKKKENEIMNKEKELKDFQKSKFGYEGELFQKRKEFVQPIQDKVYDAIEKLAIDKGYDIILDKTSNASILYANAKYDKSAEVLQILGIK